MSERVALSGQNCLSHVNNYKNRCWITTATTIFFIRLKLHSDWENFRRIERGRCLAWYDASLGRWRSLVRIRPTPLFCMDIDNGAHFCGFVSRMTKWMDLSAIVISQSKIEENQELKNYFAY